jgi:4-aminobutyrate aminotransferase-like enzyme
MTNAKTTINPTQPKNQRVHLRTVVPGPASLALRAEEDRHLAPGAQAYAITSGVALESARGSAITDVDGNTLLDFIGGIGVNGLGHSHPRFVEALAAQAAQASVSSLTSGARVELLGRLAAHAPPGLSRVQLYTSGAEAVESALRLAKSYTKKWEVAGFWGGFHGKTLGALSLLGSSGKHGLGPLAPGAHSLPYADCYRCPFGATYPSCGLACAEAARRQLRAQSAGAVAAIVVEPMQGTAGNVVPPDEFLRAVREIADEHDALLVADEMITGVGRTGRYWGVEHAGVRPDIMTIGKALGGGYPLSAVLTSDAIAQAKPWANPSGSSSSHGGNPLAAAAGAAALRIVDEEGLVENARDVGARMLEELGAFVDRYPFVGAARGRGLLLALELVRDKRTKEPLSGVACRRIYDACVARGLLTMAYAPRVRLQPALTLDVQTMQNGVAILREVLDVAHAGRWWEA